MIAHVLQMLSSLVWLLVLEANATKTNHNCIVYFQPNVLYRWTECNYFGHN